MYKIIPLLLIMVAPLLANEPRYQIEPKAKPLIRVERKKAKGNTLQYALKMDPEPALLSLDGKLVKERKGNVSLGAELTAGVRW